jgi:hypothetical protein
VDVAQYVPGTDEYELICVGDMLTYSLASLSDCDVGLKVADVGDAEWECECETELEVGR